MALVQDEIPKEPGRHSFTIPTSSIAGVYEFAVSPGRRINVIVGNAGAQAFDLVYYNFTPNEATALGITRAKAVVEEAIVATNYNKSSIAGMRTIGIELQGTSTSALNFQVLESKP